MLRSIRAHAPAAAALRSCWDALVRPTVAVAALGVLTLATSGCVFVDDDHHVVRDGPYHGDYNPVTTTIDADMVMSTDLGYGAGLFVEYTSGGTWRLWTACDTFVSGYSCDFTIYVLADSTIADVWGEELEGHDDIVLVGGNGVTFYALTSTDYDAIEFTTHPGVALEVESVLDGYLAPELVYWWGNGVLHEGAPGSPITFIPDVP